MSATLPRKRVGVPPAAQRRGGVPPHHRFALHRRRRGHGAQRTEPFRRAQRGGSVRRPLLTWEQPESLPAQHFRADVEDQRPHRGEQQADKTHARVHGKACDRYQLHSQVRPDGPRPTLQAGEKDQHRRQSQQVRQSARTQPAADRADHRQRQQHHDRLEDQRAGRDTAKAFPRVGFRPFGWLGGRRHEGSRPNNERAAPAVTTEPVMTMPVPEKASSWASSISAVAVSMASRRLPTVITRSGPKYCCATNASDSTSNARGDPLWVITIRSNTGSSAARMPPTSLSPITLTTPTRNRKSNSSASVWASAAAPAGLCAASTNTVGALRIRSNRPGLLAAANPALTASMSS